MSVPPVVDLLQFALDLATAEAARERRRADPEAVLAAEVDDHLDPTGEDVEAVAGALRARGAPVPREPPGGRWLYPVIRDED